MNNWWQNKNTFFNHVIIDGVAELHEHINYLPLSTYCGICNARINFLRKGDKYRDVENGLNELKYLQQEEGRFTTKGGECFDDSWPY